MASVKQLNDAISACVQCKRLVRCREAAAQRPPRRFVGQNYWAKPMLGFGPIDARLLVLGLAPAAHGGNRTGRVFTGDRSGDWLFAALHRARFASQAASLHARDDLELLDARVSVVVRCAPPGNKPTPRERDRCLSYLVDEMRAMRELRAIVALGSFAWDGALRALAGLGHAIKPKPRFAHLAAVQIDRYRLIGSYHVSQQNTFTGRLTIAMIDQVFAAAREALVRRS